MSLIKSADARGVRLHQIVRPPVEPVAEPASAALVEAQAAQLALEAEQQHLTGRLADLEAELSRQATAAQAALAQASAEAEARGLEAGRLAARKADDRLSASLELALEQLDAGMAGLDGLAVELARAVLERVFAEPEEEASRVTRALGAALVGLKGRMVLRVLVSEVDFPDTEALSRLKAALGREELDLAAHHDLGPGEAEIALEIGGLEVGPRQQWARLRPALEALVQPEPGS